MPKTKEELQKAYDEAMEELDRLTKSETPTEIEQALEALQSVKAEFDAFLAKSDDGDVDDKGKKKDEDEDEDEDENDEELARSMGFESAEEMHKALGDDIDAESAQQIVAASEAFNGLAKSMGDYQAATDERFEGLQKSVDLLVRGFTALSKAQAQSIDALTAKIEELGSAPVGRSEAQIGTKREAGLKKSRGEIQMELEDLQEKGELPQGTLARFGALGVAALTEDLKAKLGL